MGSASQSTEAATAAESAKAASMAGASGYPGRAALSAFQETNVQPLLRGALLLEDLPHLLGRDGDVDVPDAEVRERVHHRVGDGRRRTHGGRLADSLGAEWMVRRRRHRLV